MNPKTAAIVGLVALLSGCAVSSSSTPASYMTQNKISATQELRKAVSILKCNTAV